MIWYEQQAKQYTDRLVVKLLNENGSFRKSIIVPTAYYPLNGKMEIFTVENTKPVEDETVLQIFDSVKYRVGFCYYNSDKLLSLLRENGYDAKMYCGWLFTSATQEPIHHAWVVLDGVSVFDLSDDFTVMLSGKNGEKFNGKDAKTVKELIADFHIAAKNAPNSIRCCTVGTPTPFLLYVGSECGAEQGKAIYNNLIDKYPDHECQRNCNSIGLNATQLIMLQRGAMEI